MLPSPTVMFHEIVPEHRFLPCNAVRAHHALRGRLERLRQQLHLHDICMSQRPLTATSQTLETHLAALLVLLRQFADGRAGERKLLLDTAQAEREDRAQGEVGVHIGAGHANLEARR